MAELSLQLFQNTYSGRLPGEASIFTAEMFAVRTASIYILNTNEENGSYTLFSDFQSILVFFKGRGVVFGDSFCRTV